MAADPSSWQGLMPSETPNRPDARSSGSAKTLTERVKARVATAGGGSDPDSESRSLRRVYGEMRSKYHRYRKETGRSSLPALREAVHAFKKGPSLTSLVGVATFLDERGLLPW
jgi:hypothetical protein